MRLVYILLAGAGVGLIVGGISLDPHRRPDFPSYSSQASYAPYPYPAAWSGPPPYSGGPTFSTGFSTSAPIAAASGTGATNPLVPMQPDGYSQGRGTPNDVLASFAEETRIERQTRGLTAGLKGGGAALFATGILGLIVSLFGSIENWFVKRKSPAAPQEPSP